MSFSRYAIEKRQVSTDRGVTWQDTTPGETRYGRLVGVAPTLSRCEDMDCDLEKWEVVLTDGQMPDVICSSSWYSESRDTIYTTLLPSGIARTVTFTSGIRCCLCPGADCEAVWSSPDNLVSDSYHNTSIVLPTGQATGNRHYHSYVLDGREMISGFWCNQPSCYYINEYMPWVDASSVKLAYRVRYVREHCSDEWELDPSTEPEFVTIGERWVKTYDGLYRTTWQHQVASGIADSDGVLPFEITWQDEGRPFDEYHDVELPGDIEEAEYVLADGVAANPSGITRSFQMEVRIDPDALGAPSGSLADKRYFYVRATTEDPKDAWTWWVDTSSENAKYYIDPSTFEMTRVLPGEWKGINLPVVSRGSMVANYGGLFCITHINNQGSEPYPVVNGAVLNRTYVRCIIGSEDGSIYFPYRIPSPNGFQDGYLNATEYGFISRDGHRIPLEYIYGSYRDSNGEMCAIRGNASSTLESVKIPEDATDVAIAPRWG